MSVSGISYMPYACRPRHGAQDASARPTRTDSHITIIRLIESHDHSSLASAYLLPRDVLLELLQCSLVAFADGALSDVSQP